MIKDPWFRGIVTWEADGVFGGGMYAFIVEIPLNFRYATPRKTAEGILDWKTIPWILHPANTGVISNTPKFLPKMLEDDEIYEHRCIYKDNILIAVNLTPMQSDPSRSAVSEALSTANFK